MNEKKPANEKGQSLILVAAAMVVLVMFVAVTVDLSSAYYGRRTAQNAADGAALAGVRQLAEQINNKKKADKLIQIDVNDFAERNGIEDTNNTLADEVNDHVDAWYVDGFGNRLPDEPMVGGGSVPDGAYGVEAITYLTATTYFGGIFGVQGYPLQARAVSLMKYACTADCVVPIATEFSTVFTGNPSQPQTVKPKVTEGQCFNIWNGAGSGNFGWLNWSWQELACEQDPSRPCPVECAGGETTCSTGCLSNNLDPARCASGHVRVGDWVAGGVGVKTTDGQVLDWLDYYLGIADSSPITTTLPSPHPFTVIVYTEVNGLTGCGSTEVLYPPSSGLHYNVAGFAKMQLLGYQLSQGGSPVIMVGHDGTGCEDFGDDPGTGNRITAEFLEWVTEWNTEDACFDPWSTLRSSPRIFE